MHPIRRAVLLASIVLIAAPALADSPQFRGPKRDGIYGASGLLRSWPDDGPRLRWRAEGAGSGFSSLAIAAGRIYTTGIADGRDAVHAYDLDGGHLWSRELGEAHDGGGYPGARSTPTVVGERLYVQSSTGRAVALDAKDGGVLWSEDVNAQLLSWGIAESPLVVDGTVIFTPGGSMGTMVALDGGSGELVWAMKELRDRSAYCSPRLLELAGLRQIVTMTERHMIGVDPATGELLWRHAYPASSGVHAISPIFRGRSIYVSDGYRQGGKMLDLAPDGRSVDLAWSDESLSAHHGGVVLLDGRIYGASTGGEWVAIDAAIGEPVVRGKRLGKGAVVYADGRLYGYTERGEVLLVDPEDLEVVGRFRVTEGDGQHWAHPVVDDGTLYLRHGDVILAYDVAAPAAQAGL